MGQRIVILGADGFIGRRVVAALRATDWATPVAAVRREVARRDSVERILVDATDPDSLASALNGAFGVVNCVAGDAPDITANARALFSAAAHCTSPPRVVHLSSMAVYGASTGFISESSPRIADLGPYSAAKIAAEDIAGRYPRTVILRPGIVYGPASSWWSGNIARLLLRSRLGILGTDGEGICNLLYVDDMAAAVVRALQRSAVEGQVFNVAGAPAITWNRYFELYAEALRITPAIIPGWRLRSELYLIGPALKGLEVAMHLTGMSARLPPPIRPWLIELTRRSITLNVSAAEHRLGMQWTPVREGLARTAAWLRGDAST